MLNDIDFFVGHILEIEKPSTDIELLVWIPKDAFGFQWFVDGEVAKTENFLQQDKEVRHDEVPNVLLMNIPELGIKRSALNCVYKLSIPDGHSLPESISLRYTRKFRFKYNLTIVREGEKSTNKFCNR